MGVVPLSLGRFVAGVGARLAVAGLVAYAALGCTAAVSPPSVLLVTLDTVRADRLSLYGHPEPTSPNLAWLAARGRRYDAAFAPSSSTAPTHASLLTGRHPSFHSMGAWNSQFALAPDEHTLAERLAAAGFDTAAVVSNAVLRSEAGLDQGFAHYDDRTEGEGVLRAKGRRARVAVDRALAWLDARAHGDAPLFLWLHLQDAHGPYAPDPDWACPIPEPPAAPGGPALRLEVGRDQSGYRALPVYQVYGSERRAADYRHRYDCELAYLDGQLGRLFARVVETPALQDALLVVTADHGEAFGEDDFFFAHGHGTGLDQVRVPLIVAGPGVEAGTVETAPVGLTSIFATVLDHAGLGVPREAAGASLLRDARPTEPVWVESLNQIGAVRDGWLLRRDLHPADETAFWAGGNPNAGGAFWKPLGGLRATPLAGAPRAAPPELVAALDARAARIRAERERRRAARRPVELGDAQREALRRLGYVR